MAETGPTWETLGYITAAAGFGFLLFWYVNSMFASQKELDAAKQRLATLETDCGGCEMRSMRRDVLVTKETLELSLKPIRAEQEHRRNSMDTLHRAFEDMSKMVHRMDKGIVAIATKLNVELPEEADGGK